MERKMTVAEAEQTIRMTEAFMRRAIVVGAQKYRLEAQLREARAVVADALAQQQAEEPEMYDGGASTVRVCGECGWLHTGACA